MFKQAAAQPSYVLLGKDKLKVKNEGVSEAKHALGLAFYEGSGVPKNIQTAFDWWLRAFEEDGNGASANNIGIMYEEGELGAPDIEKAILYWKFAAFDGLVRAMQNLYRVYIKKGHAKAFDWYRLAIKKGAVKSSNIDGIIEARQLDEFDSKIFVEKLKTELKCGRFKHIVMRYEEMKKNMSKICKTDCITQLTPMMPNTNAAFIVEHRTFFREMRGMRETEINKTGVFATYMFIYAHPAKIKPKRTVDIFGLKQILFKDMDVNLDKVYEGFAIKVTIIDDAILGQPSVNLIGQDIDGHMQRIFVYNIPQNKETQHKIGYGCIITILNPYHRIAMDGKSCIRVDDPASIIYNGILTNKKRCRYCGNANGTILCRKCQRVFYCSQNCLQMDASKNQHELVCVKKLFL